jgi:hypothetical protein
MPRIKTPFLGGLSVYRSINNSDNRCVNLYPEVVETKDGKDVGALMGTPGLTGRVTLATSPVRGLMVRHTNDSPAQFFAVAGNKFYSINSSWVATERGTLNTSTGPVSMDYTRTDIMIVDGTDGYTYTPSSTTFATISDPDFATLPVTVAVIDTYFVVNQANTAIIYISDNNDPTAWNALDFATDEGKPDNLVAVKVNHRQLYTFGTTSIQPWVNTGNADFPFEPVGNTFIEMGCAAAYSICKLDNSIFWVGANEQGNGQVWKLSGYTPTRVSTHAIELRIKDSTDISDIEGYAYQDEGHAFYMLSSTSGDWTLCYDIATGLWHERAWRDPDLGYFHRHRSVGYCFFNGFHVVGDYETGEIYTMELGVYDDDGDPLRWLRTWRLLAPGQNDLHSVTVDRLQIDLEAGVGLASGQGSDPQVMLRYSDDGGHTYGNEHWASIGGLTGEFGRRAIWRRLKSTQDGRDRVFELSGSDPVKRTFIGARSDVRPNRT